ncbi:putative glycolipid-binding domain-containing protein [Microbacterium sp.]|uniref:putative glycolipid-binding domain-containing protein n=1 Tax=Microbacterium sp. TaxID=51671 RepID=UPI002D77E105|nr:putative glycolipid-binding domain-containing protein [Microbacterium sp.]HET6300621.1 putative glycolipid-binding domain-containing protein [Microbacterium sp.]
MTTLRWIGVDEPSEETCVVSRSLDSTRFASTVLGPFGELVYVLSVDADWRFRSLDLSIGERSTSIRRGPDAWAVDGRRRPDLDDAEEVDISASPLTNTLPIRRLRLEVGQHADIVTAYVSVPDLEVVPDPQRYTRLGMDRYLYESRDSDFTRTITVDEEGYVVRYPGLFLRLDG